MKMCLIGDSHVAMILAAQRNNPVPGLAITTIAAPGDGPEHVSLQGTRLVAESGYLINFLERIKSPSVVDLAEFDLVVFVSQTATIFSAFGLLREHVVSDWAEAQSIIAAVKSPRATPSAKGLLTPTSFAAALVGIAQAKLTYRFVAHLRAHSEVPIYVVPCPHLAETTLKHRPKLVGLKRVLRANDGFALASCLQKAHEDVFASFSNLTLVPQPSDSISQGCLTKESYRKGAMRLGSDSIHSAKDILHAGPLLGRLLLDKIVK